MSGQVTAAAEPCTFSKGSCLVQVFLRRLGKWTKAKRVGPGKTWRYRASWLESGSSLVLAMCSFLTFNLCPLPVYVLLGAAYGAVCTGK